MHTLHVARVMRRHELKVFNCDVSTIDGFGLRVYILGETQFRSLGGYNSEAHEA